MLSTLDWSDLINTLTTIAAALMAYLLGQRAYAREKEYELVRARYLEGGIDQFAANLEYALGCIRHNWARTLQILKLFRDVDLSEAANLADRSSFRLIEPEKIDLTAVRRLAILTHDSVYGRAQGLLFAFANESENFFVNDAGALIRLAGAGEISVPDKDRLLTKALVEANRYQIESDRFYTLLYRLQDLGRVLERQHLTLRDVDDFNRLPEVKAINSKLSELFPPEQDRELSLQEVTDRIRETGKISDSPS